MGKTAGSWSGMRKYLEQEMLAGCLQGRVRYHCTAYVGMDGDRLFELYLDDALVKRFSHETVNTYFIHQGYKENNAPYGRTEYWEEYWKLLHQVPLTARTEYTDGEFCQSLEQYRNQPIGDSLSSENPLVRMFAVLDRRVGKRTLVSIKDTVEAQPPWLRLLYNTRLTAKSLPIMENMGKDL